MMARLWTSDNIMILSQVLIEFIVHNSIEQTNPFVTLSKLSVDDLYDYIYGNNQMYIVFLPMEWFA